MKLPVTLATPVSTLVLIGGGEFSFGETREIDELLLSRIVPERRMVAFLPTASGSGEYATHFGIHDHDAELASGGRDAIDEEVAFYRRTIDELTSIDATELSGERALDRDLAIHQARLGLFWLTEYRPWAGSSGGAEHVGEALFPLFTRDFAPLQDRLASMAGRLEAAPRFLLETRERVTDPVQLWTEIDIQSTEQLPGFLDTILAAARSFHALSLRT